MVSIQWELGWLVPDMSPISCPQTGWVQAFSSKTREDDTYNRDLVGAYWTEIDQGYHSERPVYTPKASLCGQERLWVVMQEQ